MTVDLTTAITWRSTSPVKPAHQAQAAAGGMRRLLGVDSIAPCQFAAGFVASIEHCFRAADSGCDSNQASAKNSQPRPVGQALYLHQEGAGVRAQATRAKEQSRRAVTSIANHF
jgi:hypothetical protein